jgi:hypothetical protein
MSLTVALGGVGGYIPSAGRQQPAQLLMVDARQLIQAELPPIGYRIRLSGVSQNLPRVPWSAILDPDVTPTAQRGLYIFYLFDAAIERVFLSMNQGATAHQEYYRQHRPAGMSIDRAALAEIVAETTRDTSSARRHFAG